LLGYVLRPALSVKRLSYRPDLNSVRYFPKKGWPAPGAEQAQTVLEWTPSEFMAKFARLIPPARIHLVRHYGALGPRSPLRRGVARAAREKANFQIIREGIAAFGAPVLIEAAQRAARKAAGKAASLWATCLRRVFEINAIACPGCGGVMAAVSAIVSDVELERLLLHIGEAADFPKTKASRGPPGRRGGDETQVDPRLDDWDGKDQAPAD
ncbi:MAG: transposase, partial [Bryobacteraceae bacterium]